MRSIFVKIFLAFWVAEILSIFATGYLLRHHFDSPEIQHYALRQTMVLAGTKAVAEYTAGGCPALTAYLGLSPDPSYLVGKDDRILCAAATPAGLDHVVRDVRMHSFPVVGLQVGNRYLQGTEVHLAEGDPLVYVIDSPYISYKGGIPWRAMMPRLLIGFAISGVVTLILAFFLTRPIQRLRQAARRLSQGDLSARASKSKIISGPSKGADELGALVQDFDHMAERLESLVAAQRLLLRDVSHELRSPLARLSVALELARDEAMPEMETHLDRMERETSNLNKLIGQLLSLSQMESAQRIADVRPVELKPLLERLAADAAYEAQARRCTVTLTQAAGCTVEGNAELIYRALENIVRNALHYTAEETAVEISLDIEASAFGREAVIRVNDRGTGVPEEHLGAIFQPFYRLDHARERATGGFGVGLAIAERAIRLHSGRLTAKNRPGGGLVVEIRLPVS